MKTKSLNLSKGTVYAFIYMERWRSGGDDGVGIKAADSVTIWKLGRTVCVYSMVQRREKEKDSRYTRGISPCSRDRVSDL